LKDKVRILVTHQIQFLREATQILVLNEGKCMALGTFEELQKSSIDFMTLLNENKEHESPETIHSRVKTELIVPNFISQASRARSRSLSLSFGAVESFEMPEVFITSFEFQLNCEYKSIIQFVYLFFLRFQLKKNLI
jgi:ABC-type multidrug transport system ATPase subunit